MYNESGDIMSKISNVITMIELLSTGRKYSIDELSKLLEVTPRMVRVYKNEIDKTGIIIDTIMGPYGGYVISKKSKLPKRRLTYNDSLLLDKYINNEQDKELKEKLILLQDKIKGIYVGSKDEFNELKIDDKYNALSKAIKEKRKLLITYYSFDKGELERIIYPAELFYFDDGWWCAAFCTLRNDFRHFELKRIKELKILEEKF